MRCLGFLQLLVFFPFFIKPLFGKALKNNRSSSKFNMFRGSQSWLFFFQSFCNLHSFFLKKEPVRIHVCIFAFSVTFVQNFIDYMTLSMATLFVASLEKLVVLLQLFNVFQNIWKFLFFLLKNAQIIFDIPSYDAHLYNPKWHFYI